MSDGLEAQNDILGIQDNEVDVFVDVPDKIGHDVEHLFTHFIIARDNCQIQVAIAAGFSGGIRAE